MYLLLVFLPLFSSITAGLFGRKIGPKGSAFLTVSCLLITCLISCFLFIEVALNNSSVYINLIKWIDCDLFQVDWGFLFDTLTVSTSFACAVCAQAKLSESLPKWATIRTEGFTFLCSH